MGAGEDHSTVGQTFAHPKAKRASQRFVGAAPSVAGRMLLAVVLGGFVGYLLSVLIAPFFAFAFALGGAMTGGAIAVVLFLRAKEPQATGKSRTDAEVRQALADIEARKK